MQQESVFDANIPAVDNSDNSAGDNADNSIDWLLSDLYKSYPDPSLQASNFFRLYSQDSFSLKSPHYKLYVDDINFILCVLVVETVCSRVVQKTSISQYLGYRR